MIKPLFRKTDNKYCIYAVGKLIKINNIFFALRISNNRVYVRSLRTYVYLKSLTMADEYILNSVMLKTLKLINSTK